MPAPRTFHLATLGCKINQYESQSLREAWTAAGRIEVQDPSLAQDILVNSCAVTARAVRDLRQTVAKLRRLSPEARLLVTGCSAQVLAEEIASWPEVDEVIPQAAKACLLDPDGEERRPLDPEVFPSFRIDSFERARAVVKVQDGCSQHCSYCVVPLTRGPAKSREPAETLDELARLFAGGARECVLSGINLNNYGRGLSAGASLGGAAVRDFWDLLAGLDRLLAPAWEGRARLRLSSLDPAQLGAKGLETLAACKLVCPHLHLALQSGSPEIQRRMNRSRYSAESVRGFLEGYGRIQPVFGLGLDLLVGFPGEEEEHFEQTREFCASLPLSYAHVFPYSKRPGTLAAKFPNQVAAADKKRRAAILRELAGEKKAVFLQRLCGLERLSVALETPERGHCAQYAECVFEHEVTAPLGALAQVRPVRVEAGALVVEPLGDGAGERA